MKTHLGEILVMNIEGFITKCELHNLFSLNSSHLPSFLSLFRCQQWQQEYKNPDLGLSAVCEEMWQ